MKGAERYGRRQGAFLFGPQGADGVCIAEAAIDATSLTTIEVLRPDTHHIGTGGAGRRRGTKPFVALLCVAVSARSRDR